MRLLIIEDDSKLAQMLARGLGEEGFATQRTEAGKAGLAALRSGGFDLCVLDVLLPDIDGFEVLETARREGVSTPILMLTARDGVPDRVRGLNLGADDYLTKPFAFAELLARLQALLRRGTAQREGRLRCRDLELDPVGHRVSRAGGEIELSAKQFALLELLMRHPGEVLTRAMILERVWGYTFDPGTNIVDVHVAHLRQKVDRPGAGSLIETIRGVGYRMEASDEAP